MDYEFSEFNFVGAHMETVKRVLMKPNQSSALNFMHVNKLVLKPNQPSMSKKPATQHQATKMPTPKRKRTKSPSPTPQFKEQPATPEIPVGQLEKPHMVSASTQTSLEVLAVDPPPDKEEEVYNTFYMKSMRQQYLVSAKRPQDFDEETEQRVVQETAQQVLDEGQKSFSHDEVDEENMAEEDKWINILRKIN